MLKRELRKTCLAGMRSLPTDERRQASDRIAERFFAQFDLRNFGVVHVFLPIDSNNEIDTRLIIDRIRIEFPLVKIAVPRVRGNELETLRFDVDSVLKLSDWNVPEPAGDAFVDPWLIGIVIVPLLAFDQRGHRVGYGKGFYDRFLKTCRQDSLKVGVSFFPPVENIDDANENDVRLDFCLTPFNSYKF